MQKNLSVPWTETEKQKLKQNCFTAATNVQIECLMQLRHILWKSVVCMTPPSANKAVPLWLWNPEKPHETCVLQKFSKKKRKKWKSVSVSVWDSVYIWVKYCIPVECSDSQWRIQDFPERGANSKGWVSSLLEFFLNGAELSLNSEKLINHWSMNWAQFKDSITHMCLAGTVVACWSLT